MVRRPAVTGATPDRDIEQPGDVNHRQRRIP
jgi:hypothetical protein